MKSHRHLAHVIGVMLPLLASIVFTSPASAHVASHPHVQPACNAYVKLSVSPTDVVGGDGTNVHAVVNWGCAGYFLSYVYMFWGDGSESGYTCYNNCGSGTTSFNHSYNYVSSTQYDYAFAQLNEASGKIDTSNTVVVTVEHPQACHPVC